MLLRGVKFNTPVLDKTDIEVTKSKAQQSGRSFGGVPFQSHNGRGRGRGGSYQSDRPNPFAAHIPPNYAPPQQMNGPPGWVPPPPGANRYPPGPPPPQQYNRNQFQGPPPPYPPRGGYGGGQYNQWNQHAPREYAPQGYNQDRQYGYNGGQNRGGNDRGGGYRGGRGRGGYNRGRGDGYGRY